MKFEFGTSRTVFIIGKLAFKMPIITKGMKWFLKGWIGNIDEMHRWRKLKSEKLCPVYFSFWGLINVMPKVRPITFYKFKIEWVKEHFKELPFEVDIGSGWKNFGYINSSESPVLIDYAISRTSTTHTDDCDGDCNRFGCIKNSNEIN